MKEKKIVPTPEEYFKDHPEDEVEEYMSAYPDGFNLYIGPAMYKDLEEEHFSKGLPMIGQRSYEDDKIIFRYRNNRIEYEFVNELQITCYWKDDLYITGYLPIIFSKGNRVFVVQYTDQECLYESQYGVLIQILEKHTMMEVKETYIGYNFFVKLEGIDRSKIPTFEQYYKK